MEETGFFFDMNQKEIAQTLQLIDLTSLSNLDNPSSIDALINKANLGHQNISPAAVCTFSCYADQLTKELNESINSAVVAGYFPSGQASLEQKKNEFELIATSQVNEVDIVINRGELIAGNTDFTNNEIKLAKEILVGKKIKVIIESGELNHELISLASKIAIDCEADFIKTSTGKSTTGATTDAVEIMCHEIKKSQKNTGIKVSGGIRTASDAITYMNIVREILGNDYLQPHLFRIGASSLYDALIKDFK